MPARATIGVRFPETARDAAVLLVEQMWTAITDGQVVVKHQRDHGGLTSWLSSAARCLGENEKQQEPQRMFKVVSNPTFSRSIGVDVPVDGGYSRETVKVTYRVLPTDEAALHDLNSAEGSLRFLQAVVARLDDLVDETGQAVPYSDALRDRLLNLPYVRSALARGYFDALSGARQGN